MRLSRRALAIALAGSVGMGGVFLGTNTSAAWKGETVISQVNIEAGDVQASTVGPVSWVNLTDPAAGEVVFPGDTVRGTQAVDVALMGDNLKLIPTMKLTDSSGNIISPADGYTVTYRIASANGAITYEGPAPINTPGGTTTFTQGNLSGRTLDGVADLLLEVTIKYPDAPPEAPAPPPGGRMAPAAPEAPTEEPTAAAEAPVAETPIPETTAAPEAPTEEPTAAPEPTATPETPAPEPTSNPTSSEAPSQPEEATPTEEPTAPATGTSPAEEPTSTPEVPGPSEEPEASAEAPEAAVRMAMRGASPTTLGNFTLNLKQVR